MSEYDDHLEIAYEMTKHLGTQTGELEELIKILLSETARNITDSLLNKITNDRTLSSLFGPIIESMTHQMKWSAKQDSIHLTHQ